MNDKPIDTSCADIFRAASPLDETGRPKKQASPDEDGDSAEMEIV